MASPNRRPLGSFEDRARSVPYRRSYVSSVALCLAYYLCLVGAIAAAVPLLKHRQFSAATTLGIFLALAGIFWFLSYLKRRDATCPLCKGTPLLDSQALKHQKAVRIPPFNYGTTNVIRIIARQQFRCHFCGTPYDLLKDITASREQARSSAQALAPPNLPPAVIPPIAGSAPQTNEPPQTQDHAQATTPDQPASQSSAPVA